MTTAPGPELAVAIRISYLTGLPSHSDSQVWYLDSLEACDGSEPLNSSVLSEEKRRRVQRLLEDGQYHLDIIDGEIFRAAQAGAEGDITTRLLGQREVMKERLREMRIAVTPLRNIPPEILGRVFQLYVGSRVILPPKPESNPWKLGHVSSHWRNVLWRTSEIWRNIEIALPRGFGPGHDVVENFINTRKLFQSIVCQSEGLFSLLVRSHDITPIVDLILPASHRLTRLSMRNISPGVFHSLAILPPGSLPFLETLTLDSVYDPKSVNLSPASGWGLQAAPMLKHVDFSLRATSELPDRFVDTLNPTSYLPLLPWPQLTCLILTSASIPWTAAHVVLNHCLKLVFCRLTIRHVSDAVLSSSIIILFDLKEFQLMSVGPIKWDEFFYPFRLPCLRYLKLKSVPSRWPDAPMHCPEAITALILRSNCRLESLSLGGETDVRGNSLVPPVIISDLHDLLHASPSLEFLEGSLIIPSSIFVSMQRGLLSLSQLRVVACRVQPDGLQAFINFLNPHIHFDNNRQRLSYSGSVRDAKIFCHNGHGYKAAYQSLRESAWMYRDVRIRVQVTPI